jgi:hypothetical protein
MQGGVRDNKDVSACPRGREKLPQKREKKKKKKMNLRNFSVSVSRLA